MNWKEFFKPNWKKFILFMAIIMLEKITNTLTFGYYLVYGLKLPSVLIINPFDVLNWIMVPILITPEKSPAIQLFLDTMIGVVTQLFNLLWQYFLVCATVFIYGYVKKTRRNHKNEKGNRS